jgi:Uma2 family endonuclease
MENPMSMLISQPTEAVGVGTPEKLIWTDEAFMALPDDGHRYEIVNGELIDMGNLGAKYGYLAIMLSAALFSVVMAQRSGALFDSSTAFKMKDGNKRSPDIFFSPKNAYKNYQIYLLVF